MFERDTSKSISARFIFEEIRGLLVKGIFYKTKKVGRRTYHNELEASYIRRI